MDRQELSDAVWERIEPHLPGKTSDPDRTGRDNRLFVEAILWLARSGAHWRVLPVRIILTGGERSDITQIKPLLDSLKAGFVLADKGYNGQRAIDAINAASAIPIMPRGTCTVTRRPFDPILYKERNLIERLFNKLKHFRRIATRYDKLARNPSRNRISGEDKDPPARRWIWQRGTDGQGEETTIIR